MGVRGMAIKPTKIGDKSARQIRYTTGHWPAYTSQTLNGGERTGTSRLDDTKRLDEAEESLYAGCLTGHLQNDAILAHVDDPRAKLVREHMQ
jgi:hypothetical protein